MKIYTKKGDTGETSLLGGKRVKKNHPRIMAYGTIDELNSHLGWVRSFAIKKSYQVDLLKIQKHLFNIGSCLAVDAQSEVKELPQITEEDILYLENQIDEMENNLPVLTEFILPGGNQVVAACHISRSVARRAERLVVILNESEAVEPVILKYLNRLTDYLFVLARSVGHDSGVEEVKWK
jgi:cob(I)alamin adenosyltransferase